MLTHADGATVRYTEWVHYPGPTNGWAPKWETSYGTELYNHTFDAGENRNLFASVRGTALAKTLAARLHGGWEGSGRSALTHRKYVSLLVSVDGRRQEAHTESRCVHTL